MSCFRNVLRAPMDDAHFPSQQHVTFQSLSGGGSGVGENIIVLLSVLPRCLFVAGNYCDAYINCFPLGGHRFLEICYSKDTKRRAFLRPTYLLRVPHLAIQTLRQPELRVRNIPRAFVNLSLRDMASQVQRSESPCHSALAALGCCRVILRLERDLRNLSVGHAI